MITSKWNAEENILQLPFPCNLYDKSCLNGPQKVQTMVLGSKKYEFMFTELV